MGAAAVPLVVAAIGAGTAIYTQRQNEQAMEAAARKTRPIPPAAAKKYADQSELDVQAVRRRRAAAGLPSTALTGPQGLGTNGLPANPLGAG